MSNYYIIQEHGYIPLFNVTVKPDQPLYLSEKQVSDLLDRGYTVIVASENNILKNKDLEMVFD